ncbi:MAG TPA: hypothetical protein VJZ27_07470 [Aggregatilineales bacterium]|nr:hypothetical protein [Aggregatilineales bacterium]
MPTNSLYRFSLFLLLCIFLLSACSGGVYDRAYTASGDGQSEDELSADEQFAPDDDLNVVIKLNRRDDSAHVMTRFIDPNGELLQEIEADAAENVGTVVMGVDFEAKADQVNLWTAGRYTVEVLLDGEKVDTLFFRVD